MLPGELGGAAALDENCVDDVATEYGHAPPPSLVARTMSCDIRELCGELRHLPLRSLGAGAGHLSHQVRNLRGLVACVEVDALYR